MAESPTTITLLDGAVVSVAYARPVVHAAPPVGSGLTPCCRRPPFELAQGDRMTLDAVAVTCPTTRQET